MEVEAERDLSQTIVHVDVDAFYAAVECQRDPSLKGKAFGVGQGVLTTASVSYRRRCLAHYSTRRGSSDAAAAWRASLRRSCARTSFCKLCPALGADDSTPLHFDLYTEASRKIRAVLVRVSFGACASLELNNNSTMRTS